MTELLHRYAQAKDKSAGENVITASCILFYVQCVKRRKIHVHTTQYTCIHWCNITPRSISPVALSAYKDGKEHNTARFSGIFLLLSMRFVLLLWSQLLLHYFLLFSFGSESWHEMGTPISIHAHTFIPRDIIKKPNPWVFCHSHRFKRA